MSIETSPKGVSVIICCYNSVPRLSPTLEHLAKQQTDPSLNWEVIVVNNASSDDTARVAQELWDSFGSDTDFVVVDEPQAGLSFARHKGVETSRYEYFIFCDDDNWMKEDYVQNVFEILEAHPEVAATNGDSEAVFDEGFEIPDWFDHHKGNYAVGKQQEEYGYVPLNKAYMWGAGLAIRKTAMKQMYEAGFESLLSDRKGKSLVSGGDIELCYALMGLGYELWYSDKLFLKHYMPSGRITWEYLMRLSHGSGLSRIFLTPYLYLLKDRPLKVDRFMYIRHLMYLLKMLLERHIYFPLGLWAPKPGRHIDTLINHMYGRFIRLWSMKPADYKQVFLKTEKLFENFKKIKNQEKAAA